MLNIMKVQGHEWENSTLIFLFYLNIFSPPVVASVSELLRTTMLGALTSNFPEIRKYRGNRKFRAGRSRIFSSEKTAEVRKNNF